jgi:hypothetical protein
MNIFVEVWNFVKFAIIIFDEENNERRSRLLEESERKYCIN